MTTSDIVAPTEADPSNPAIAEDGKPRNRTWTVEVTYMDGSNDRETVKCVSRESAYVIELHDDAQLLRVDGEGALVVAKLSEVRKVRVSKGA